MVKPFQFLSALLASMSLALAASWTDRPTERERIHTSSDYSISDDSVVIPTSTAFISAKSLEAVPPLEAPSYSAVAPVVVVVYPPTAANPSYNIVVTQSPNAGTQTYQIVVGSGF